ncbi:response regulator receiver domain protein [Synechococcus sp. PCC 7335]|uniref:response regulator n=1 Tax=Synechococcus sp. (strain ATCC 29403 / PCC 7335) TaxID=91464 RepID=UPI00017EBC22|nr:response regulator [Synechococcus sp. PCC 7335]EDX84180.1 response regulator receiver domain protein [Synechococcus sp. PCC 7335]
MTSAHDLRTTGDILIVDDQPENLQLLLDTLSRQSYELRRVLSGQLAIQVAQFDPPDLILLDIRMPDMDGYEVCRQLKTNKRTRDIPVIFLSALDDPVDKVKAFDVGGADYVSKPFQVPEVLARVRHQLQIRQLQRQAEEQQQQLQRRAQALEMANQELEFFSSSASHDLTAPLRGLQSLSEVLIEDYGDRLDELGQTYLHRIRSTAIEMDLLLKTLLDYSRMSRTEFSVGPVSLQAVVANTLQTLRSTIESSGADIEVQPDLPSVVGFSLILERVASNLLTNALKYVEPGSFPRVYIGAERKQQTVRWFFQDSGIGISEDDQARIFKPFERLHGSESYPGTGFGLAIVQRGITQLGGYCGVESELGKGSRFWIELRTSDLG